MIDYKEVSMSNQVLGQIEERILSGSYPRGMRIDEDFLSKELGVNRKYIREALVMLTYERLINEKKDTYVVIGINENDVEDVFYVKRLTEISASVRASKRITEDGIKELEKILEQQERYAQNGDAEKVRNLDTFFHDCIYKASGSPILEGVLSPMHHKMMKYRKVSLEHSDRIMKSVEEHRKILNAIKERNEDAVGSLMLEHIEHAYKGIKEGNK